MNKNIYDFLYKNQILEKPNKILPHQLSTIDFLIKSVLYKKNNVLLFHKMGSGKTMLSLIFAFIISKYKKIKIILPNTNIKKIWIEHINLLKLILPYDEYELENIIFYTKKSFFEMLNYDIKKATFNKYKNNIIFIDEFHNLLNNNSSNLLLTLKNKTNDFEDKCLFLLITGSPIINTILTLKNLINILTKENFDEKKIIYKTGNKVYNLKLSKDSIDYIKKLLDNKISFYEQDLDNIPKSEYIGEKLINLPIILCKMSKKQNEYYNKIKKQILENKKNEMFLKYLLDASFSSFNDIKTILNFDNLLKSKTYKKITEDLYIHNGIFIGEELKNLNNSCKLKFFVEKRIFKINKGKYFIYFSNATIGGRFIKDMLYTLGIQEYGQPNLKNFVCFYCNKKKTCKNCKPIKYIMITSVFITNFKDLYNTAENNINNLLNVFNETINDDGSEIMFLFGSKLISESYTLKEVKEIWFLTIPDSSSELKQIIARAIRTFSYKNLDETVKIYILSAITNDFDINILKKKKMDEIENILDTNNNIPYDIKKILYLEIKYEQTDLINEIFKSISDKNCIYDTIDKNLELLVIYEVIKNLSYYKTEFDETEISEIINSDKLLISEKNLNKHIKNILSNIPILINKKLNQSFLLKNNKKLFLEKIFLNQYNFDFKIKL